VDKQMRNKKEAVTKDNFKLVLSSD